MSALTKACKALSLAQTYAEDGAVESAITYATEGMALLFAERDRRMKMGLMRPPALLTAPASPKAARKGKR